MLIPFPFIYRPSLIIEALNWQKEKVPSEQKRKDTLFCGVEHLLFGSGEANKISPASFFLLPLFRLSCWPNGSLWIYLRTRLIQFLVPYYSLSESELSFSNRRENLGGTEWNSRSAEETYNKKEWNGIILWSMLISFASLDPQESVQYQDITVVSQS